MNNMTKLLDKIERRLGTQALNLPEHLRKDKWATVVKEESIVTFSRFFPNKITVILDKDCPKKGEYFLIDYKLPDSVQILGIRDINWEDFSKNATSIFGTYGAGMYNYLQDYSMDSVLLLQARADMTSLFNNGIYLDFKEPNMVRFRTVTGFDISLGTLMIPVDVLCVHSDTLTTISPTAMETFEGLAQADVAKFLYGGLKYFDGLETVYANIDLKISDFENEANKREEIVQTLRDGYVSAANKNQPIMFTV